MPPLPPSRAPGAVGAPDDSLVVSALWRAIRVLFPLALVYAVWAAWTRRHQMQQPTAAFTILGVLAVWDCPCPRVGAA